MLGNGHLRGATNGTQGAFIREREAERERESARESKHEAKLVGKIWKDLREGVNMIKIHCVYVLYNIYIK